MPTPAERQGFGKADVRGVLGLGAANNSKEGGALGPTIFVFAYLKGQGKKGWIISVLLSAFAWLGFDLLFVRLLRIPFADELLWR